MRSMPTEPVVFLIGGPDAGKTNFLGRLWLCLRSKQGFLSAEGLPDDAKYVAQVSQELLKGRFAGHSPLGEVTRKSQVPVRWMAGDKEMSGLVVLPDRKGEQWKKDFKDRVWSQELEELLSSQSGCLLFIRAASDAIVPAIDPMRYAELFVIPKTQAGQSGAAPAAANVDSSDDQQQEDEDDEIEEEYDDAADDEFEKSIPTQVLLMDWLQCLRQAFDEVCGYDFKPRIGIVIAAWDLVPSDKSEAGPSQYLKSSFPMLWQFIITNSDRYNFHVFGSSVAGVDLEIEELRETYCNGDPGTSGSILHSLNGHEEESSDFTLPLAWALGAYGENSE